MEYMTGAFLMHFSRLDILKAGTLGILLVVLLILYTDGRKKDSPAILVTVLLSLPGILLTGTDFMPAIFIGVAFAAVVLKKESSIFFTLLFYILANSLERLTWEKGLFFLINGILISLLPVNKKEKKLFWYSFLLIISADIIILLVNSNFSVERFLGFHSAIAIGSVIVSILIGNIAGDLFQKRMSASETKEDTEDHELTIESILREDFELYKELKASEKLFLHAGRIAAISEGAAIAAGLDRNTARAGGLYHEIGRLKGKDYVAEGIALAKEYHLPEAIINIIASHNLKADKPASPEGAVVMFTVSLVAAKEYFLANRREEDKKAMDLLKLMLKFIDNLFAMRLEKDSLSDSNLTVAQYIKLKNFYLDYYGKEEDYLDTEF
ncbi:HDIG domain-containing metalloprotein [Anaerocolumna xylanovorans]|uniref:HDIG domain-containing protein n=1 Tax=Anaerocolumna xylanovorans DSM 12503 TaxID=1121345 RepID=A0A1M7YC65_9FIRM|nr:HDIG domain-containing metalloprotein [Anaerocolumna xylanovorans]SHO50215.1 HDIG domain-containing protein [Anaerocolumna xylanovorans DSM 12503]